jgi:hypothetical protein
MPVLCSAASTARAALLPTVQDDGRLAAEVNRARRSSAVAADSDGDPPALIRGAPLADE